MLINTWTKDNKQLGGNSVHKSCQAKMSEDDVHLHSQEDRVRLRLQRFPALRPNGSPSSPDYTFGCKVLLASGRRGGKQTKEISELVVTKRKP